LKERTSRRHVNPERRMPTKIPVWVTAILLLGALLLAAGGVIALVNPRMLASPNDAITAAVRVYAGYLASRNFVLALMLFAAIANRARLLMHSLAVIVGLIQIADVIFEAVEGRWLVVPGVLILGLLFFLAASQISGAPFWKREAWSASQ
jgi:hypothetical protein